MLAERREMSRVKRRISARWKKDTRQRARFIYASVRHRQSQFETTADDKEKKKTRYLVCEIRMAVSGIQERKYFYFVK